jgi:hypothetical protein
MVEMEAAEAEVVKVLFLVLPLPVMVVQQEQHLVNQLFLVEGQQEQLDKLDKLELLHKVVLEVGVDLRPQGQVVRVERGPHGEVVVAVQVAMVVQRSQQLMQMAQLEQVVQALQQVSPEVQLPKQLAVFLQ